MASHNKLVDNAIEIYKGWDQTRSLSDFETAVATSVDASRIYSGGWSFIFANAVERDQLDLASLIADQHNGNISFVNDLSKGVDIDRFVDMYEGELVNSDIRIKIGSISYQERVKALSKMATKSLTISVEGKSSLSEEELEELYAAILSKSTNTLTFISLHLDTNSEVEKFCKTVPLLTSLDSIIVNSDKGFAPHQLARILDTLSVMREKDLAISISGCKGISSLRTISLFALGLVDVLEITSYTLRLGETPENELMVLEQYEASGCDLYSVGLRAHSYDVVRHLSGALHPVSGYVDVRCSLKTMMDALL